MLLFTSLSLLSITFCVHICEAANIGCGVGFELVDGVCYFLEHPELSFAEAKEFCEQKGAKLFSNRGECSDTLKYWLLGKGIGGPFWSGLIDSDDADSLEPSNADDVLPNQCYNDEKNGVHCFNPATATTICTKKADTTTNLGSWADWSEWTLCDHSYNTGKQRRVRECRDDFCGHESDSVIERECLSTSANPTLHHGHGRLHYYYFTYLAQDQCGSNLNYLFVGHTNCHSNCWIGSFRFLNPTRVQKVAMRNSFGRGYSYVVNNCGLKDFHMTFTLEDNSQQSLVYGTLPDPRNKTCDELQLHEFELNRDVQFVYFYVDSYYGSYPCLEFVEFS